MGTARALCAVCGLGLKSVDEWMAMHHLVMDKAITTVVYIIYKRVVSGMEFAQKRGHKPLDIDL